MLPIRTRASNIVMRGPSPDVGDCWAEIRGRNETYVVWKLSDEERAAIAAGANIELGIFQTPMPPVSLNCSELGELSEAGAKLRDRAITVAKAVSRGPQSLPPGYWVVSTDVWKALNDEAALDASAGVPTLLGRPLMEETGASPDTLEYAARFA